MTRAIAIPAGCYLAIALGVPLLNGAATRPAFAQHAATLLGVVATFALLASVMRKAVLTRRR